MTLWKRFTIELSGVRTGNRVLDIAGGTGDLAAKFSKLVGPTGQVVLADINGSMLKVGRDRLLDKGVAGNIEFVQADAEKLPFPDNKPRQGGAVQAKYTVEAMFDAGEKAGEQHQGLIPRCRATMPDVMLW